MEWLLVGVAEPVEQREDGGQNLTLVINLTDTGLDGAMFTCKLTTVTGKDFEKTITIEVKGQKTSFRFSKVPAHNEHNAGAYESRNYWGGGGLN